KRCVPLLVTGRLEEIEIEITRSQTLREQSVVACGSFDEEHAAPLGEERVDGLFAGPGPGRLEDPQHPVRKRVGRDRRLPVLLRHCGGHAVVVADLEAVRPPRRLEVALRRHLLDPPSGDPCPRATRIHEHLDAGHAARVPVEVGIATGEVLDSIRCCTGEEDCPTIGWISSKSTSRYGKSWTTT